MSLICCECGDDVQPGAEYPGREGGMLHINEKNNFGAEGLEKRGGVAVCFRCLKEPCGSEKGTQMLAKVFEAYNAEVEHVRFCERYGLCDDHEGARTLLLEKYVRISQSIPESACLGCGTCLPIEGQRYFRFRVMDRLYGEKRRSFFGSYQWSFIKEGNTSFMLCHECCSAHLPRAHAHLMDLPMPPLGGDPKPAVQMIEKLSKEQQEAVNKALPKGMRYIGKAPQSKKPSLDT